MKRNTWIHKKAQVAWYLQCTNAMYFHIYIFRYYLFVLLLYFCDFLIGFVGLIQYLMDWLRWWWFRVWLFLLNIFGDSEKKRHWIFFLPSKLFTYACIECHTSVAPFPCAQRTTIETAIFYTYTVTHNNWKTIRSAAAQDINK